MSDEIFVPFTEERKEMFKTYLFWYEKYMIIFRQYSNAAGAWNDYKFCSLKLRNSGIDPDSNIFNLIKTDECLIKCYLGVMKTNLYTIDKELENLYTIMLSKSKNAYERIDKTEIFISHSFETVKLAVSRYMKRLKGFRRRCLDVFNSINKKDCYSMLLP